MIEVIEKNDELTDGLEKRLQLVRSSWICAHAVSLPSAGGWVESVEVPKH
jgi:hypothetical protein